MPLRRQLVRGLVMLLIGLGGQSPSALAGKEKPSKSKADKGPAKIDVSAYPEAHRKTYPIFAKRCSQCHTLARPINTRMKKPEDWKRYIKRMMNKPGCKIKPSEGKRIYMFLKYREERLTREEAEQEKKKVKRPEHKGKSHQGDNVPVKEQEKEEEQEKEQEQEQDEDGDESKNSKGSGFFNDALGPMSLTPQEVWKRVLHQKVIKPACCGSCVMLSRDEARTIWPTMMSELLGGTLPEGLRDKREAILDQFRADFPHRYNALYGSSSTKNEIRQEQDNRKKEGTP